MAGGGNAIRGSRVGAGAFAGYGAEVSSFSSVSRDLKGSSSGVCGAAGPIGGALSDAELASIQLGPGVGAHVSKYGSHTDILGLGISRRGVRVVR